jgi:hypothetical protein
MAPFIENRIAALEGALPDAETLEEVYRTMRVVQSALKDLKQYIHEHPFTDRAEEIQYFKVLAPPVYGRLFYYTKVADICIEALHANEERMEALLRLELANIERFFTRHSDFCQYQTLNKTFMDDRIFIRDARENEMVDCIEVIMAEDFCVGCYWAALLWANRELRVYLHDQLRRLKQQDGSIGSTEGLPVLEWTDSLTDLVEVLYGIYVKGSINRGKASLKDIARGIGYYLKADVINVYSMVKDIARRKKAQVKYLTDMCDRASKGLEEMI